VPFDAYYKNLYQLLQGEGLLKQALEVLNNDSEWDTSDEYKGRTVINAFAMVYDRLLFKGAVLGDIWYSNGGPKLAACFNATEFYKGMSFRFQTPANAADRGYRGNKYLHFTPENEAAYKRIKLGDIMAASSCFPAGFEPVLYPRDFAYKAAHGKDGLDKKTLQEAMVVCEYDDTCRQLDKTVAMMDGGITDNQGLYSAMVADERERRQGHGFDLIMSTDVASYFMDSYNPPVEKAAKGWRSRNISYYISKVKKGLQTIKGIAATAGAVLAAAILMVVMGNTPLLTGLGCVLIGITATVVLLLLFVMIKANRNPVIKTLTKESSNEDIKDLLDQVNAGGSFSPSIISKLSYYLSRTRLNALELMVKARISSVITMVMDINLKQVRRLIYELLYSNEKWQDRRTQNAIYDISSFNRSNRRFRIGKKVIVQVDGTKQSFTEAEKALLLDGCDAIEKIAEEARNMGTTLWFDETDNKNEMLKKIIVCGQFTTCANLLEYVMTLQKRGLPLAAAETAQLQRIRTQLEHHWQQFKADPFFLYRQAV
jgi:hypothetical protein